MFFRIPTARSILADEAEPANLSDPEPGDIHLVNQLGTARTTQELMLSINHLVGGLTP